MCNSSFKKVSDYLEFKRFLAVLLSLVLVFSVFSPFTQVFATDVEQPTETVAISTADEGSNAEGETVAEEGSSADKAPAERESPRPVALLSRFRNAVSAEDEQNDGTFRYVVNGEEVTILGFVEGVTETNVVIPDELDGKPVTRIGNQAFYFGQLTQLTLGQNVREIQKLAFAGNALTEVTFPDGLQIIKKGAFRDNALTTLDLNHVEQVGDGAFSTNKLTTLNLGEFVQSLGDGAFSYNDLSAVNVPSSLNSVGEDVFSYNKRFVRVNGEEPFKIPTVQKTPGGFGYITNPIRIIVRYVDVDTGAAILDEEVLGDDLTSDGNVFVKNAEQTIYPKAVRGYEAVLPEGQDAVIFTPDRDEYLVELQYRRKDDGYSLRKKDDAVLSIAPGTTNVKELLLNMIEATDLEGNDLRSQVEISPASIDTNTPGVTHKVQFILRTPTGEVKRLFLNVYIGTDLMEFPLGSGWVLGDFTYGEAPDDHIVTGFSESGKAKASNADTLVLPHINPHTNKTITKVVSSEDSNSFRKNMRGIATLKDFEGNITEVGDEAFSNTNLSSVQLPSVRVIGQEAFADIHSLQSFNFDHVELIKSAAFSHSTALTFVKAPNLRKLEGSRHFAYTHIGSDPNKPHGFEFPALTEIGESSFIGAKLSFINQEQQMPKVTKILGYAFSENFEMREVILSETKHVGNEAFYDNTKMIKLIAPKLEYAGDSSFHNNSFQEAELPKLKEVGNGAFFGIRVERLLLPELETMGTYEGLEGISESVAFAYNFNNGENVNRVSYLYAPKLRNIPAYAFYGQNLTSLTSENLPLVETIGAYTFELNQLTELNLPTLQRAGKEAFSSNQLREVHLANIQSLGELVFKNYRSNAGKPAEGAEPKFNPGLEDYHYLVVVHTDNPNLMSRENYLVNPKEEQGLEGSTFEEDDFIWDSQNPNRVLGFTQKGRQKLIANQGVLTLPDRVQVVASGAFPRTNIKELYGPAVQEIETGAFASNYLSVIDLPVARIIGSSAFAWTDESDSVPSEIPALRLSIPAAEMIGNRAFYKANVSKELNLPAVTEIGDYAFDRRRVYGNVSNTENLIITSLVAPNLEKVGDYAFYEHEISSLAGIPNLKFAGRYSFSSNRIEVLDLPHLEEVERSAFSNPLKKIELPSLRIIEGESEFSRYRSDSEPPLIVQVPHGVKIKDSRPGEYNYPGRTLNQSFSYRTIVLTEAPNPDGTLQRLNPDNWESGNAVIVNPSTVKVHHVLADGTPLDGQDGRPLVEDYREYMHRTFTSDHKPIFGPNGSYVPSYTSDAWIYRAPEVPGYVLVAARDAEGVEHRDKKDLSVPYESEGAYSDRNIYFVYEKLRLETLDGPRLEHGISNPKGQIVAQEKTYTVNGRDPFPQMVASYNIEEVKKTIKNGKLIISWDSPYIDPHSIEIATSEVTDAWYKRGNWKITDHSIEITLNENISAGQTARAFSVIYRFKKGVTPDHAEAILNMDLQDGPAIIAQAQPTKFKLVYESGPSLQVQAGNMIHSDAYPSSNGPRVMGEVASNQADAPLVGSPRLVEEPSSYAYSFTMDNVHYPLKSVRLTATLPEYTAVLADGTEEIRRAVFVPAENPGWTLSDDGVTLVYENSERDRLQYLPELKLKYPSLKLNSNVVLNAYLEIKPYLDPNDKRPEVTIQATGDLGEGDSLTTYAVVNPKPPLGDELGSTKGAGLEPRRANYRTYLYDTPEDREKDITYSLHFEAENRKFDTKDVAIIDYGLDSRLKYKALRFDTVSQNGTVHQLLIQGRKKAGADFDLQADQIVFEIPTTANPEGNVTLPDEEYDYLFIKFLDTERIPFKGYFHATVVTTLKDKEQPIFNNQSNVNNTLRNSAIFLANNKLAGTDTPAKIISNDDKYANLGYNYIDHEKNATIDVYAYNVSSYVTKEQRGFPDISSGEVLLEGKSGSYSLDLNARLGKGSDADKVNVVYKNVEVIDILPEGLQIQAGDIKMHPNFVRSGGSYRVDDAYPVMIDGKETTRTALIFTAPSLDTRAYSYNQMNIAAINAKFIGQTTDSVLTNRVYAKWDNTDIVIDRLATNADKTVKLNPHGKPLEEGERPYSYDAKSAKVLYSAAVVARLEIRNLTDRVWGAEIPTSSLESFDYRMTVANYESEDNTIEYEGMELINIFPSKQDLFLNRSGERNKDGFVNTFDLERYQQDPSSLVVPEGYVVSFLNTDLEPKDFLKDRDVDDLVKDPAFIWSATPAANTKGIRITAKPGVKLVRGEKIHVIVPMKAPEIQGISPDETDLLGKNAYDTFVYRHLNPGSQTDYRKFVEPNKVHNYTTVPKGSIRFVKYAKNGRLESDDQMQPIAGAGFELVRADQDDVVVKTAYSDSQGVVHFNDVLISNYIIREFAAPYGYSRSDYEHPVSIQDFKDARDPNEELITVNLTREQSQRFMNVKKVRGTIKIVKRYVGKDSEGFLPNVRFKVTGVDPENNSIDLNGITNKNGEIILPDLPEGNYLVKEEESILFNRYEVSAPQYVSIRHEQTNPVVTFVNQRFRVLLKKIIVPTDAELDPENWHMLNEFGKRLMTGYTFKISAEDGEEFITSRTDYRGSTILEGLTVDKLYTIEEIEEPSATSPLYRHNPRKYTFRILPNGKVVNGVNNRPFETVALNFPNIQKEIKGKFVLAKTDNADPAQPLEGARFTLRKIRFVGSKAVLEKEIGEKVTTLDENNEATAVFNDLAPGTYQAQEVQAPDGYLLNNKVIEFTVPEAVTDSMVYEKEYDVTDRDSIIYSKKEQMQNKKSHVLLEKGSDVVEYTNVSRDAAEAYIEEQAAQGESYTYRETGPGLVTVYKQLKGVAFEVYELNNGQKTGAPLEVNGTSRLLTDEKGKLDLSGFAFAETKEYGIYEVATLDGYRMFNGVKRFRFADEAKKIGFSGTLSFYVNNPKIFGSVTVSKMDWSSKQALSGATFAIYAGTKATMDETKPIYTAKTNKHGYFYRGELPLGDYVLREVQPPEGYMEPSAEKRDIAFSLTGAQPDFRQVVHNVRLWSTSIEKQWVGGSEGSVTVQLQRTTKAKNAKEAADRKLVDADYETIILAEEGKTDAEGNITLNPANQWRIELMNLPNTAADGKPYYYRVIETDVSDADYTTTSSGSLETGFTITNTSTAANQVSIGVTKAWDLPTGTSLPEGLGVEVVVERQVDAAADTWQEVARETLTAETGAGKKAWQHTFAGLQKRELGQDIVYRVRELTELEGFTSSVTGEIATGITITNTATKRAEIKVEKTWAGSEPKDLGIRFHLYDAEEYAKNKEVAALAVAVLGENQQATFENVPSVKFVKEGQALKAKPIRYFLKEVYADGKEHPEYSFSHDLDTQKYTTEDKLASSLTVKATNSLNQNILVVEKKWVGIEAKDAPEVRLVLEDATDPTNVFDVEGVDEIVLNQGNEWKTGPIAVAKYKEDGTEAVYRLREVGLDGYEFSQESKLVDQAVGGKELHLIAINKKINNETIIEFPSDPTPKPPVVGVPKTGEQAGLWWMIYLGLVVLGATWMGRRKGAHVKSSEAK